MHGRHAQRIPARASGGQACDDHAKAVEAENLAVQKEVAALSTCSSLHVVAGAGHIIQADKPQAVVDAVNEVLDCAGY
jgi:pimeloyl-ACP methyl ester carboxylesterase